jgi:hypothetical protein
MISNIEKEHFLKGMKKAIDFDRLVLFGGISSDIDTTAWLCI